MLSPCFSGYKISFALMFALGMQNFALAELDLLPSVTVGPSNFTVGITQTASLQVPTDIAVFPDGSGRMLVAEAWSSNLQVLDSSGTLLGQYYNSASSDTFPFVFNDVANTSVVFHPGFADSASAGYKKFYAIETEVAGAGTPDFEPTFGVGETQQSVIYEYTVDDPAANVIDSGGGFAKREVLRLRQAGFSHNINDLLFDQNELLYVSIGDGENSSLGRQNAQPLGNVNGKILRIDPLGLQGTASTNGEYSIPTSNPFVNTPGAVPEILAYGLRNPYRISLDPVTQNLYIGDVGENNIEEINVITNLQTATPGGQNFGWAQKEGSYLFPSLDPDPDTDGNGNGQFADANGLTDPLLEYDHQDGASVIGGFVYRGSAIPSLVGKYVFADQQGNRDQNEPIPNVARLFYGDLATGEIFEFNLALGFDDLPTRLVGVNESPSGEILLLSPEGVFLVVTSVVVPEPSSFCLAMLGVAILLGSRGRSRKLGL